MEVFGYSSFFINRETSSRHADFFFLIMNKKCPECKLTNFANADFCKRCNADLSSLNFNITESNAPKSNILKRAVICGVVCLFVIFGFYLSLIGSAKRLNSEEKQTVQRAINIIEQKGFSREAFLLNYLTAFRGNDNWLNASIEKENAYAATNFPFEIITIYPDFFNKTNDDLERAAILLHEAQHLKGADEKDAYSFVWKHKRKLGWTAELYGRTVIYQKVGEQTKEFAPDVFKCDWNETGDCTQ